MIPTFIMFRDCHVLRSAGDYEIKCRIVFLRVLYKITIVADQNVRVLHWLINVNDCDYLQVVVAGQRLLAFHYTTTSIVLRNVFLLLSPGRLFYSSVLRSIDGEVWVLLWEGNCRHLSLLLLVV